jgi:hypothetical protein
MPTTDQIRAAMEWAETRDDRDIAYEPEKTEYHMNNLAACVWELYEAAKNGLSPLAEYKHRDMETVNRYRAALEGGDDE